MRLSSVFLYWLSALSAQALFWFGALLLSSHIPLVTRVTPYHELHVLDAGCWRSHFSHILCVLQRAITAICTSELHSFFTYFRCEHCHLTYFGDHIIDSIYLCSCNNVGIVETISTTIFVRSHSAFEVPLHEPLAVLRKPPCP